MAAPISVVWGLMRGHRTRYGLAFGCLVAATGANYLVPLVGTAALDHALAGRPAADATALVRPLLALLGGPEHLRAHLWLTPVAMVILAVGAGVFSYLKGWLASLASDGIARELKERLYDHLNHLPARYHDRAETGDLVQRCTSDVETTRQFLATQVMEIGQSFVLVALALPLLLTLHGPLTAVAFALIGPLVIYGFLYFRKVKHVFLSVDQAEGALTSVIQENLTGIRVVRAFARQDFEREKFATPNARFRDTNVRLLRLMAWYWSISDFVSLVQLGLVLLVGAWWIGTGTITVGTLFAFLAVLHLMLWPVRQMGRILTELGKTLVAVGRIGEILAVAREVEVVAVAAPAVPPANPAPEVATNATPYVHRALARPAGALAVRDLHFAHDPARAAGTGALNGLSFDVAPGETLAILGPSGAGKSTLMHLLLRLYDYERGTITLDGQELRTLPRAWVRSQIGVVMQEPFLFAKNLRDNIRLGRGDASEHEVAEAAQAACIHETIVGFSSGYDTVIGERGITLSGGQRQRVALARAIVKRPPLLILDDALSAVDGETETLVLDALRRRRGQATTLVIAHRLSTLVHADRVLVLEHGRIIQSGTHADLSRQPGLYRRLWEIQTSLEEEVASGG